MFQLQLTLDFTTSRLTDIILFVILIVAAIVALRLLLTVMSPRHRRRFSRVLRYSFILGILFGLVLPWNESVGILAAAITSLLLLSVALHYAFLQGRVGLRIIGRLIPASWATVSRESVRDVFLFFSIVTGVIGIITTVLSILVPPIFSLSLSSFVPLSFDTISVLSAMLEFTFATPHRGIILSLVRKYLHEQVLQHLRVKKGTFTDTTILTMLLHDASMITIRETDLPVIVSETGYSVRDISETLDTLVKDGLVLKEGKAGAMTYRLTTDGFKVIQSPWEEAQISMASDRRRLEGNLSQISEILAATTPRSHISLNAARNHLSRAQRILQRMHEEYGQLLDREWSERAGSVIREFSLRLHEVGER